MKRWLSVFAWLASMWILWALLVPERLSPAVFGALAGFGVLALSTVAVLADRTKPRSVTRMLDELDAEAVPVQAGRSVRR
jgi:hypothetical protein